MRLPILIACLIAAGALAKPAKKGDPMAPDTWKATPAAFEGKTVRTAVLGLDEPGLVAGDAPAAAVLIRGGNEQEDTGGEIVVVIAPGSFQKFVETYSTRQMGGGRSGFGALSKARVAGGTFVRIQGEPVLLVDLAPAAAAGLPKPSEMLRTQAELARAEQLKPSREGWQRKPFLLSRLDQRGAPETSRELQRLADLANAQAAKDKTPRANSRDLVAAAKSGETRVIADEKAKVEWLLTWK